MVPIVMGSIALGKLVAAKVIAGRHARHLAAEGVAAVHHPLPAATQAAMHYVHTHVPPHPSVTRPAIEDAARSLHELYHKVQDARLQL